MYESVRDESTNKKASLRQTDTWRQRKKIQTHSLVQGESMVMIFHRFISGECKVSYTVSARIDDLKRLKNLKENSYENRTQKWT